MEKKSVHFIGIGGTGLSAIARVLSESGYIVTGSDRQMSPLALELKAAGVRVVVGHDPQNISGADLVIRSSAIPDQHIEVQAALKAGIPVLKRSEFLPELLSGKRTIAVAGTHGKTTTTAMVAWLLSELNIDPSFIVGGVVDNLGINARKGKSDFFVIEADEYDRMFLGITPEVAIVTNVEFDHPDCFPDPENFYQAFVEFTKGVAKDNGKLVACIEDKGAARLCDEFDSKLPIFTYGFHKLEEHQHLDYQGVNLVKNTHGGFSFGIMKHGQYLTEVNLSLPGRHNALNALCALVALDAVRLPVKQAARLLNQFRGAGRRFDIQGEVNGVVLIDDYAHHPTEIQATLSAAKERYPESRIIAVWQPHTYSRVLALWDGFMVAFNDADRVVVTDIYAAREQAPERFSMAELVKKIQHPHVQHLTTLEDASNYLLKELKPGDIVLVLSAGDADKISQDVMSGLKLKGKIA